MRLISEMSAVDQTTANTLAPILRRDPISKAILFFFLLEVTFLFPKAPNRTQPHPPPISDLLRHSPKDPSFGVRYVGFTTSVGDCRDPAAQTKGSGRTHATRKRPPPPEVCPTPHRSFGRGRDSKAPIPITPLERDYQDLGGGGGAIWRNLRILEKI